MKPVMIPALLALTVVTAAAEGPEKLERDSWRGPVAPGTVIRIDNPFGDLRIRHGGAEDILEVAAVMQQLATNGSRLELVVDQTDTVAEIRVVRRAADEETSAADPADRSRADLAVLIPAGHPVIADTKAGLIEARGVRSDLDLTSVAGQIRVAEIHGAVDATTDRGAMEISLRPDVTKREQRLTSITGPITVFVSPEANLDVELATSGLLTTDFTIVVDHDEHAEPDKHAAAVIGQGGRRLVVTSKRGDLTLRRLLRQNTD